jgi:hypothetical protein
MYMHAEATFESLEIHKQPKNQTHKHLLKKTLQLVIATCAPNSGLTHLALFRMPRQR